jgi:hypothetical protein
MPGKSSSVGTAELTVSWLPMLIILVAQIQMACNVNAIPVSIGPIVAELGVSSTTVGTALVFYSLFVAAFVMLCGWRTQCAALALHRAGAGRAAGG